ncbi:hypothetical protein A9P82_13670 [Arachidicoccus ginsenosidimutans]|uniref:FecR family protein n=1 Tax=Arachidicoccus sp. BS20 TaxID=1850526 RepID=UPI0007F0865C|nr:FecR domain-containing protein [Arachidicoccus sp. BS20]ANI90247.1 hypothetical protein A9P82_13670 [Arachidicoccus sp. BS20]
MENSLLKELLEKYLTGVANEDEARQLTEWYQSFNDENIIVPAQFEDEENNIYERLKARMDATLNSSLKTETVRMPFLFRYKNVAAAAIIIVLLGSGFWWWSRSNISSPKQTGTIVQNMIQPGRNGAILTLADGTQVVLDSSNNGQIGVQGSSKIVKQGNIVTYTNANAVVGNAVQYNTMSTPRGREFQIVLPDGTKAWLNAASSIKYPTAFNDSARLVSITGEVYFEVAHQLGKTGKRVPFVVQTDRMSVKVLGTHFDVNAYPDEQNYKATLFEGSVEVYGNDEYNAVKIVPGQQAQMQESNAQPKVSEADLDKAMAWRNGMFQFDDDKLDNILKQVARWYDVDVDCAADKRQLRFNGVISRRADVADILHLLSVTGVVNFKVNGRKIYAY